MLKLTNFLPKKRQANVSKADVSAKELVRQDLLEGSKQTITFEDGFQSLIFGENPKKSGLQRVLSSVGLSSKAHESSQVLQKELTKARRSQGLKKWGKLALGLAVAAAPVALGVGFAVGAGAMLGLAATSALAATGAGMEFRESNSKHKQMIEAEQRIPGLADRAAERLQSTSSQTKVKFGRLTEEGAVLLR